MVDKKNCEERVLEVAECINKSETREDVERCKIISKELIEDMKTLTTKHYGCTEVH